MKTLEPMTGTTDVEQVEAEAFHITSDGSANWYLRKLANIEAEQRRVKAQAEAIVRQLEAEASRLRYLYEAELEEYVREKLVTTGNRRKSVHFLQGTAGFRTVPQSVRIADTLAALDYATRCLPEAVKTQQVLDAARYRRIVEETGELLPGVTVVPTSEAFRVSFGKQEE
jgi:phage host-nuclease inhibitor protein Gam